MKLYHHPMSSNARKVVIVQKLLDLEVELALVDLAKGEQMKPAFLAMNPNHAVPVLEDDGFTMSESHAIMIYLCEAKGAQTLYPSDRRARAKVNQWMFWCSNHWSPAIAGLNFENNLKKLFGQGDPDPAFVARHERFFAQYGKVLDGQLDKTPWVTGSAMTLADISIATPLMYAVAAKLPIGPLTNVQRWLNTVTDLPVWKETNPF